MAPAPGIELLFIHVPKTGGTSVKLAMIEAFSADAIFFDYDDEIGNPLKQISIDPDGYLDQKHNGLDREVNGRRFIVGHLWAKKYETVKINAVGTVLRDPITRAISHYYFWLSTKWPGNPIHSYMLDSKLTFEQFSKLPIIRKLYTGLFFRDVDMEMFDVIMRHDNLRKFWPETSVKFGINTPLPESNHTSDVYADYRQRAGDILSDSAMMARLRDTFADDLNFYEKYCA